VVVDHKSSDNTLEIASKYGCEVISEEIGLGYARQLCFDHAGKNPSKYIVFVDSDVVIREPRSLVAADRIIEEKEGYGAVVGMARGHSLAYGLPASLLVLRAKDFAGLKIIPDYIDARETFFIQNRLDNLGLKTYYIANTIVHSSQFRQFKPEWEGANTRLLPSSGTRELVFAFKVVCLLSLNSRNFKNLVYVPIFYLKFVRGYANPKPWLKLRR
jgi:glycosyltransferase involved in cell wall biosynthesis